MSRFKILLLSLVLFIPPGCGGSSSNSRVPITPTPTPINPIPNLSAGPHLGYIVGFDALSSQQMTEAETRFGEAVAAGMRISRVQLGWDELETSPGVFELGDLMLAMDAATVSGQQAFFTLTSLDTGELTLPTDLMAPDRRTVAAGLTLDGPEIKARFEAFLDWLVPELAAYDTWGLALANEPSTLFESISQQEVTNFLIDGAIYAKALDNRIAITATIAGAVDNNAEIVQFVSDLMPQFDIASFNYYCLASNTLQTTDQATWAADMDTFVSRAEGRPIFFQELGCPAGWGDLGGSTTPPPQAINASPQVQAVFFNYVISQIEAREELRAATVFQLNDWSPTLARLTADPFRLAGDPITADRLEEWLATVGLCRWSDGVCRQAYDEFLSGLATLAAARGK